MTRYSTLALRGTELVFASLLLSAACDTANNSETTSAASGSAGTSSEDAIGRIPDTLPSAPNDAGIPAQGGTTHSNQPAASGASGGGAAGVSNDPHNVSGAAGTTSAAGAGGDVAGAAGAGGETAGSAGFAGTSSNPSSCEGGEERENESCGDGCICKSGKRTETLCTDSEDNDADSKLNCKDLDCAGQVCRPGSLEVPFRSVATRDIAEYNTNEGMVELDNEETITISSNPKGARVSIMEFGDVPADPAINVLQATLWIYVETGGKPLKLFDADGKEHPTPTPPADPGFRSFDVTALVTAWVSNTESRRSIKLGYGTSRGAVVMHATEFTDPAHAPHIDIFYEAVCDPNGVCPQPSLTGGPG